MRESAGEGGSREARAGWGQPKNTKGRGHPPPFSLAPRYAAAMCTPALSIRLATRADLERLRALMDRAIGELQSDVLTPEQVAASRAVMGLDTQLIDDGTYFAVERAGRLAGCGGWSFRRTLYGGDGAAQLRAPDRLDPAREPARIRAMYTDPASVRMGVGRLILATAEAAARGAGFASVELMATLAGERLYRAAGYLAIEPVVEMVDGVAVPLIRMGKALA
jgi:GNAT superfamily N-acetyltransferase